MIDRLEILTRGYYLALRRITPRARAWLLSLRPVDLIIPVGLSQILLLINSVISDGAGIPLAVGANICMAAAAIARIQISEPQRDYYWIGD